MNWSAAGGMEKATRPGSMHGSWLGPGEALGANTQLDDGDQNSGFRVYAILNGKILCCAPCQLRRASTREAGEYQLGAGAPLDLRRSPTAHRPRRNRGQHRQTRELP